MLIFFILKLTLTSFKNFQAAYLLVKIKKLIKNLFKYTILLQYVISIIKLKMHDYMIMCNFLHKI